MIIKEALKWGREELKKAEVSETESSVILLLADVLGKDRAYIYAHEEVELTDSQLAKFKKYVERRKGHEPVWYIIGKVKFYGREFMVNNDVLTPRPETEFLIQEILQILNPKSEIRNKSKIKNSNDQKTIIEVGTGSGIIAITLAKELGCHPDIEVAEMEGSRDSSSAKRIQNDNIRFIASDISEKALDAAKKNAKMHGVEKDIEFLEGDLLEPIKNLKFKIKNSTIVANLPYISHEDMESLQLDVLHHEPRVSLDGGIGGLEIYERLLKQMKELDFSGMAFFEIGIDQGEPIKKIIHKYFPEAEVEVKGDLAGIDRIVTINFQ